MIQERLHEFLDSHVNSPFLFIGSGFSRRYLGLESWGGLLEKFSAPIGDYEYYLSRSEGDLPVCAEYIAHDYADYWWKDEQKQDDRDQFKHLAVGPSSPLKIDIANYIKKKSSELVDNELLSQELSIFESLNIHGFITTNWDTLLESLFPQYKVFIGQSSILTGTPHNIGEIFKIHGCCTDPNSMILTKRDYDLFNKKRAYLAAKLITIFVEHPVIFLGYSISDPNIVNLLKSIIDGLSQNEIDKLQKNLIFIQRNNIDRTKGINSTIIVVNDAQIPVTQIVTDDFISVYNAIHETKLKLPARVLRFCREQIYNIVSSKEPSERLALVDIDEIDDHDNIEFVVGVGVIKSTLSDIGYLGISARDIFANIIYNSPELDPNRVISDVFPNLCKGRMHFPMFKYLQELGVKTFDEASAINQTVQRLLLDIPKRYQTGIYEKAYNSKWAGKTTAEIIDENKKEIAAILLTFQKKEDVDVDRLSAFIQDNFEEMFTGNYGSFFRKTICFYDYITNCNLV